MNMSELSKNLKHLRACKGVTQETLAKHLLCSTSTVSNYENGVHEPGNDMLVRIADYYGVSTGYLLGCSTDNSPDDILSQVIYDGYTLGRLLQLLAYLEEDDRFSLVHFLRILEGQRMPKNRK